MNQSATLRRSLLRSLKARISTPMRLLSRRFTCWRGSMASTRRGRSCSTVRTGVLPIRGSNPEERGDPLLSQGVSRTLRPKRAPRRKMEAIPRYARVATRKSPKPMQSSRRLGFRLIISCFTLRVSFLAPPELPLRSA